MIDCSPRSQTFSSSFGLMPGAGVLYGNISTGCISFAKLLRSGGRLTHPSLRLYVANHCSFWDGILLNEMLRRHRAQPLYCMIEEPQVRKHPFFRRIGGFSIDRGRPRDIRSAIDYASDLLNGTVRGASRNRNAAALVVFPQGEIQPNDVRPLGFKRGIARILKQRRNRKSSQSRCDTNFGSSSVPRG